MNNFRMAYQSLILNVVSANQKILIGRDERCFCNGYLSCDDGCPDLSSKDDGEPVDEDQAGDNGQEDHPEPQEDVDLLVDDVQRQDAQRVVLLNLYRKMV